MLVYPEQLHNLLHLYFSLLLFHFFLQQEQTWFGNEAWKSFGIQMIPLTSASEMRDNPEWVEEMLPQFEHACIIDKNCGPQGWSILVFAAQAEIGNI